jgi:hypothetical protein
MPLKKQKQSLLSLGLLALGRLIVLFRLAIYCKTHKGPHCLWHTGVLPFWLPFLFIYHFSLKMKSLYVLRISGIFNMITAKKNSINQCNNTIDAFQIV